MRRYALFLLIVFAAACATNRSTTTYTPMGGTAPPAALSTVGSQYVRAWQDRDVDTIARFYADNAVVLTPEDQFRGRSEIRDRWISSGITTMSNFQATPEHFTQQGDVIAEVGRYSFRSSPPGETPRDLSGVYTQIWRRQSDGAWRVESLVVR